MHFHLVVIIVEFDERRLHVLFNYVPFTAVELHLSLCGVHLDSKVSFSCFFFIVKINCIIEGSHWSESG